MAVTRNLMVRAGADFSAITKQAEKASASMKKMSTSISSSAGIIKKALGAIGIAVSLRAVVNAAKDAKAAYDQQAEAETKLAQAMRNTMGASADEVKEIKKLCAAQQELGIVGDEVQLAGAQQLSVYLKETGSLKKLIPVMNDVIAQQYGYDASAESATSVATMFGKVMEGQTTALKRQGYQLSEAQEKVLKYGTEEQRAAVLASVVEARVGGMNQALAQTPTGRMKQLKNTLSDIKEQFGRAVSTIATAFLPLLNKVASVLSTIANIATRVAQSIANVFGKKLETATSAVSAGTGAAAVDAEAMAEALGDVGKESEKAGKKAQKAAKSLMAFDELNLLNDSSASEIADTADEIKDAVEDIADIGGLGGISDLFDIEGAVEGFSVLENALSRLRDAIGPIIDDIKTIFGGLYDFVVGVFTGDWERAMNGLGDAVSGFGKLVNDVISRILVPAFDGFAGFTIERIGGLLDWISEKTGIDLSKVKEIVLYQLNVVRYFIEATAIKIGWIVQDLADVVGNVIRGDWDAAWKAAQKLVQDASMDIIPTVLEMAGETTQAMLDAANGTKTSSDDADTAVQQASQDIRAALDSVRSGAKKTGDAFKKDVGETGTESANKFSGGFLQKINEFNLNHMPGALGKIFRTVRTVLQLNKKQNEFYEAGEDSAEGYGNGWTDFWHSMVGIWITDTYGGLAEKVCKILKIGSPSKVFDDIGQNTMAGFLQGLSTAFKGITTFFSNMVSAFSTVGSNLVSALQSGFGSMWGSFTSTVSSLVSSLTSGISSAVQTAFSGLGTAIGNAVSTASSKLQELAQKARSSISTVLENGRNSLSGIVSNIQGAVNNIISQANSILARIRGRSYATGGFPEDGVFFANHHELVGQFSNGKTAVANNEQIIDGIRAGVVDGLLSVLGGSASESEQPINVYIGDELVYTSFTKWSKRQQLLAGGRL